MSSHTGDHFCLWLIWQIRVNFKTEKLKCDRSLSLLHYGSTNPMIRMYILMLDTRNEGGVEFLMKQMKMYICTLKNIYSSRCSHIAVHG